MSTSQQLPLEYDPDLLDVAALLRAADPDGARVGKVLRSTFDQLYDGQHTGRFRWDQLFKTEKTHFGTLFEINLRRAFADIIRDGERLDYKIAGHEIDCKYSFRLGGWMLPPEALGQLLLVCTASDENAEWALGVVRAKTEFLRPGKNRDLKTGLNELGRSSIDWVQWSAPLPPNVLLALEDEDVRRIFAQKSGQQRVNELFRIATGRRIGRNTVATVAQQDDYMKRVRYNGGARSALQPEGYVILGGDYSEHQKVAEALGLEIPAEGEFISARVMPAIGDEPHLVEIQGTSWTIASDEDPVHPAPTLNHLRV